MGATLLAHGCFHESSEGSAQWVPLMDKMSSFVEPWMSLLDDRYEKQAQQMSRFVYSEKTSTIIKTKRAIINMLKYVIDCCLELQLQATFAQYGNLLLQIDEQTAFGLSSDKELSHSYAALACKDFASVSLLKNMYIDLNICSDDNTCGFCFMLLDLCQYTYSPLVLDTFKLMFSFFCRQTEFTTTLKATRALQTRREVGLYLRVKNLTERLAQASSLAVYAASGSKEMAHGSAG